MRLVVQRVQRAAVDVDGSTVGRIAHGLFVLVGVGSASTVADAEWLAAKIEGLRIFADAAGRMNRSVVDVDGEILAVSQFTLYADTQKGRRPSFVKAAEPEQGQRLYERFCGALHVPVARGVFGAHMLIDAVADGPVTLVLEREGT